MEFYSSVKIHLYSISNAGIFILIQFPHPFLSSEIEDIRVSVSNAVHFQHLGIRAVTVFLSIIRACLNFPQ